MNSHSFRYQRITANARVYLRLPYGGVYADPADDARRIRRYMEEYLSLSNLAAARGASFEIAEFGDFSPKYRCHIGAKVLAQHDRTWFFEIADGETQLRAVMGL